MSGSGRWMFSSLSSDPSAACHTQPSPVIIRTAQPMDVPLVLQMIRELADFEHLRDACVVSTADLQSLLFGPQAIAHALLAHQADQAVGFALCYPCLSTFKGQRGLYVEDLYVRPAWRQQGIGQRLLQQCANQAGLLGCAYLEWRALNWNESAIGFYRRLGAQSLDSWMLFRLHPTHAPPSEQTAAPQNPLPQE